MVGLAEGSVFASSMRTYIQELEQHTIVLGLNGHMLRITQQECQATYDLLK